MAVPFMKFDMIGKKTSEPWLAADARSQYKKEQMYTSKDRLDWQILPSGVEYDLYEKSVMKLVIFSSTESRLVLTHWCKKDYDIRRVHEIPVGLSVMCLCDSYEQTDSGVQRIHFYNKYTFVSNNSEVKTPGIKIFILSDEKPFSLRHWSIGQLLINQINGDKELDGNLEFPEGQTKDFCILNEIQLRILHFNRSGVNKTPCIDGFYNARIDCHIRFISAMESHRYCKKKVYESICWGISGKRLVWSYEKYAGDLFCRSDYRGKNRQWCAVCREIKMEEMSKFIAEEPKKDKRPMAKKSK